MLDGTHTIATKLIALIFFLSDLRIHQVKTPGPSFLPFLARDKKHVLHDWKFHRATDSPVREMRDFLQQEER
jgi:hypothetical protein